MLRARTRLHASEAATGKEREGRVDDVGVVCSEREEAGLAAAAVALRRLSGLVALRRDLAALVAAARRLLRGGGAVAPVGRAPAATVGHRPALALVASVEPVAPRGARRRGRAQHRVGRGDGGKMTLPRRCGTRPRPRGEGPARQDRREPTRRHSCTSLDGLGRESKRVRGRGLSILGLQESKLFAACTPFRRPKSFGGGQKSNARAPNCSRVCDNVSTRIFTCRAERLVAPLVCRASGRARLTRAAES